MAKTKVVNFGSAKGGLSTVGYTIYGVNGSAIGSRATSGVVELGTNTGVYAAQIEMPDYDAIILWDTGEVVPRYATEDYQFQIQSIENSVGRIDNIYTRVKNIDEFMSILMERFGLLEKNIGLQKVNEKLDNLSNIKNPSLADIEKTFKGAAEKINITAVSPKVDMTDIKIPDYNPVFSKIEASIKALNDKVGKIPTESPKMPQMKDYNASFEALRKEISGLLSKISLIPTQQKEYKPNFDNMVSILNTMQSALAKNLDEKSKDLREQILKIQGIFARFDGLISKIAELKNNVAGLDSNDEQMKKSQKEIDAEIRKLQKMLDPIHQSRQKDRNAILMSYGDRLNG